MNLIYLDNAATTKIDKEVLDYAKSLKVVSNYAVGLDNIDVEYAKSKKIIVCRAV